MRVVRKDSAWQDPPSNGSASGRPTTLRPLYAASNHRRPHMRALATRSGHPNHMTAMNSRVGSTARDTGSPPYPSPYPQDSLSLPTHYTTPVDARTTANVTSFAVIAPHAQPVAPATSDDPLATAQERLPGHCGAERLLGHDGFGRTRSNDGAGAPIWAGAGGKHDSATDASTSRCTPDIQEEA